jgi:hypothetical protein
MKKQKMTVEERMEAISELNLRQAVLQSKIDIAKAAEDSERDKRSEHRRNVNDRASQIIAEALPEMLNAGGVTVYVSDYWAGGTSKSTHIAIGPAGSGNYDFSLVITDGNLHSYSAYSQSGKDAEDAKDTIKYYERVSTLLSFVCNHDNKEMLSQICEMVNVPYSEGSETATPNLSDMQNEMREINAEIRKLQVYAGAKGHFKHHISGNQAEITIVKVTPKKFYFRFVLNNRYGDAWDDCAAIDDRRFTFAELAA